MALPLVMLLAPKAWKQIQGEKASTGKTWIWSQQRLHGKLGRFFSRKKKTWQTNQWGWKTCSFTWSLCIFCDSVWMIWFMVLWKDAREKYIKFIIHGILNLDVEIFWILTVSYRCSCLSFAILSVWFHTASVPGVCTCPACPTFVAQTAGLSIHVFRWIQCTVKTIPLEGLRWWTESCTNLIDMCHTEIFGALCLHILRIHVCVRIYGAGLRARPPPPPQWSWFPEHPPAPVVIVLAIIIVVVPRNI